MKAKEMTGRYARSGKYRALRREMKRPRRIGFEGAKG